MENVLNPPVGKVSTSGAPTKVQAFKPNAEQKQRLTRWRNSTFSVCLFGYMGYYLGRKNLAAAFPLLTAEFGYSNTQLGLIAAYSEVAYAVGKFINGPLGDKVGGKKIFLTGLAGAAIFNVVFSQMSELSWFIVAWCICRYFLSMGWGGLAKMVGAWFEPSKNGTAMGLVSINFQFGGVLATLLAGALVANGAGWQEVFIVPAMLMAGVFVWSYFAAKNTPQDIMPGVIYGGNDTSSGKTAIAKFDDEDVENEREATAKPLAVIGTLLKLPLFRQILLYSFLTTFLRSIFFFWTPKFLVDIGMGTSNAILKSALFPFLGAIGTIFLGWYTDKHAKNGDRGRMMWIMLSGLAVSVAMISVLVPVAAQNHGLIIGLLGAAGFFLLGPYSMSSGCLTLDIAGSKGAGSCTGMIDGVGYMGGALASIGVGMMADSMGWSGVFMVITAGSVLAVFSAYLISREFQKRAKSA